MPAETIEPASSQPHSPVQVILAASEKSNRELAQSLHDTLCQTLAGTTFMASVLATQCKEGQPLDPADLDTLCKNLSRAIEEARVISFKLQPVYPRVDGLMLALERLAEETSATTPCSYTCQKPALISDPDAALTLYRIAQEAVRIAQARSEVTHIRLTLSGADGVITLTVSDDGRDAAPNGAGKLVEQSELMRCRTQALGGNFVSESKAGEGTIVTCIVPRPRN